MAILRIARMGHPILMKSAEPVLDPTAAPILTLVIDMVETMMDAPGIGLAAPQVHAPLRVVVYRLPEGRVPLDETRELTVLINPVITVLDETTELGTEGCLSLPGMRGLVPRPVHIRVQADTMGGETLDYEAHEYHARVVQHECDHLDGILYPMRMESLETFGYIDEAERVVLSTPRQE